MANKHLIRGFTHTYTYLKPIKTNRERRRASRHWDPGKKLRNNGKLHTLAHTRKKVSILINYKTFSPWVQREKPCIVSTLIHTQRHRWHCSKCKCVCALKCQVALIVCERATHKCHLTLTHTPSCVWGDTLTSNQISSQSHTMWKRDRGKIFFFFAPLSYSFLINTKWRKKILQSWCEGKRRCPLSSMGLDLGFPFDII